MLKDITLGQFFPGETFIHKLDPRVKLTVSFAFIIILFLAKGIWAYVFAAALLLAVVRISKTSFRMLLRSLKPVFFIILFTSILNIFYVDGTVLVKFWIFEITKEGLMTAFYMTSRIVLLIAATSILTYTTSPIALTDALEYLMAPLNKIKFPVHDFAMMMTIAMRFIPTLIEETDKIMSAQKARGADFESGNIFARAKALIPILVPLFVSAFRRADELATAMECRLYQGGEGRTRMKVLKLESRDYLFIVLSVISFAGIMGLSLI